MAFEIVGDSSIFVKESITAVEHTLIEAFILVVIVVFLFAAPWLFAFDGLPAARRFFLGGAAAMAVIWTITDYRAIEPMPRHFGPVPGSDRSRMNPL